MVFFFRRKERKISRGKESIEDADTKERLTDYEDGDLYRPIARWTRPISADPSASTSARAASPEPEDDEDEDEDEEDSDEEVDAAPPSYTVDNIQPAPSSYTPNSFAPLPTTPPQPSRPPPPPPSDTPPFPILNELIILACDLRNFTDTHRVYFTELDDRTASYECDKALLDVDMVNFFVTDNLAKLHTLLHQLCTDSSINVDPNPSAIRTIDAAFSPLLGRMRELSRVMHEIISPPPPLSKEERRSMRMKWNAFAGHGYLVYHQYASQAETHIRKHLREIVKWVQAEDFAALPLKAKGALLMLEGGRWQRKFQTVGAVTRFPCSPMSF